MHIRRSLLLAFTLVAAVLLGWTAVALAQAGAPACTNAAALVDKQVSPGGQPLDPGEAFSVSWELENTGDCTWTRVYRLLPVDGDRMGGPSRVSPTTSVRPGRRATFALALVAPDEPGFHQSIWRLSDAASGVPFGPWLAVEVEVAAPATRADDVILPEVLVLGGRGGGGGGYGLDPCIVDDEEITAPALVLETRPTPEGRTAYGYICGYDFDTEVTVTLTSPTGETFTRAYLVEVAEIYPEEGDSYTRPLLTFTANWPARAPTGRWIVTTTDGDAVTTDILRVPRAAAGAFGDYPVLDTYPIGSIDPFAAAEGCRYAYTAGEQFIIAGSNFTPTITVDLGIYQERGSLEYLLEAFRVTTDRRGAFTKLYTADEPAYGYTLRVIQQIDPDAFLEDSQAYDPFINLDAGDAWGCFSVKQDPDIPPLHIAYVSGDPGSRDVELLNHYDGFTDRPIYGGGECDTTDPTWWPGDEWVIYSSNCTGDTDVDLPHAGDNYDLYAYQVFRWETPGGAPITRTPDTDETEPNVAPDGRIVYRAAPAGSSLGDDGQLRVLSAAGDTDRPLGINGRAPAWSPDAGRIAYMSDVSGAWRIYVYDLESEQSYLVGEDCPTHCRFPAWSPDGQWILYNTVASRTNFAPTGLWLAPADGGASLVWLNGPYGRPSWSRTGWIAFNGPDGLYRARAVPAYAGTPPPRPERYLINAWSLERPYWAPAWSH